MALFANHDVVVDGYAKGSARFTSAVVMSTSARESVGSPDG